MTAFHGSNTGAARTGAFRAGGTGDDNANRTSRRCTPNRRANARTDNPSRSRARRICSYNATFDLVAITHGHNDEHPRWWTPHSGAKSDEHYPPKWGQIR
jgi:hypothetical protein